MQVWRVWICTCDSAYDGDFFVVMMIGFGACLAADTGGAYGRRFSSAVAAWTSRRLLAVAWVEGRPFSLVRPVASGRDVWMLPRWLPSSPASIPYSVLGPDCLVALRGGSWCFGALGFIVECVWAVIVFWRCVT